MSARPASGTSDYESRGTARTSEENGDSCIRRRRMLVGPPLARRTPAACRPADELNHAADGNLITSTERKRDERCLAGPRLPVD